LESAIDQYIRDVVRERQPNTVQELAQLVGEKFSISQDEALSHVMKLSDKGHLRFRELPVSLTYVNHVFGAKGLWYWVVVALAIGTSVSVFTISKNAFPLAYLRNLLGSVFVLFVTGFCLMKALFPRKELGSVEIGALSVLGSLTVVSLTSLVLNFTSWGITATTVTLSLLVETLLFATIGLLREHGAQFYGFMENSFSS
jgi:hypothetical protein